MELDNNVRKQGIRLSLNIKILDILFKLDKLIAEKNPKLLDNIELMEIRLDKTNEKSELNENSLLLPEKKYVIVPLNNIEYIFRKKDAEVFSPVSVMMTRIVRERYF